MGCMFAGSDVNECEYNKIIFEMLNVMVVQIYAYSLTSYTIIFYDSFLFKILDGRYFEE